MSAARRVEVHLDVKIEHDATVEADPIRALASDDGGDAIIEVMDECGGLAIVREAVVAHGGTVEARDQAPRGCLFILRWPLSPRPAADG